LAAFGRKFIRRFGRKRAFVARERRPDGVSKFAQSRGRAVPRNGVRRSLRLAVKAFAALAAGLCGALDAFRRCLGHSS
jgi:hypothetical protein